MTRQHWSTLDVESRQRFSYWSDAVCQAILHVDAESQSLTNFEAHISGEKIDEAKVATFISEPHRILRTRAHISRSNESGYLVSWQKTGRSHITQGDVSILLEAGEIGVIDAEKSFHVDFPTHVSRTLVLIPRRRLEEKAPWFRRQPYRIAAEDTFARLARDHLSCLTADTFRSPSAADLLIDNFCNLLALATVPTEPTFNAVQLPMEALLAFCKKNLHRPELSPNMAALQLRMSVRTVHLRFERMGTTFGSWVLSERLDTCKLALENSLLSKQTISEIAFDRGFREISHFSKTFKSRFGISPRDYRAAKLASAPQRG
jgi:AraC family transcriptional activator of tynA and feaB